MAYSASPAHLLRDFTSTTTTSTSKTVKILVFPYTQRESKPALIYCHHCPKRGIPYDPRSFAVQPESHTTRPVLPEATNQLSRPHDLPLTASGPLCCCCSRLHRALSALLSCVARRAASRHVWQSAMSREHAQCSSVCEELFKTRECKQRSGERALRGSEAQCNPAVCFDPIIAVGGGEQLEFRAVCLESSLLVCCCCCVGGSGG